MTWQISNDDGANWLSFEECSISKFQLGFTAAGTSTATFEVSALTSLTDDNLFAYGSSLLIRQDDVIRFSGIVTSLPRFGANEDERQRHTVSDPWWHLEHCVYQQRWKLYNTAESTLSHANKSRVVLFQNDDGDAITAGAQIQDAIEWAITKGAPMQVGTIDAGPSLPMDEQCNITCADVISTVIRTLPNYVVWFDFSTTPATINCRFVANLTTKSLAVDGSADVSEVHIVPRYDMQVPGVRIIFEKSVSVDGAAVNTIVTDEAGNPEAFGAVELTIDLQGASRNYLRQDMDCETYPEDLNDETWWAGHLPWIANFAAADLVIHNAARTSELPRYIIGGDVQDWMEESTEDDAVTAKVSYTLRDANNQPVKVVIDQPISVTLTATTASTRSYTRLSDMDSGESVPTGMAAALYTARHHIYFEGSVTLIESEPTLAVGFGTRLQLTGGRAEWASMNALVQQVSVDVDQGTTTISFGPPAMVEADSLLGIFRAARSRRYAWSRKARDTGEAGGDGDVVLPAGKHANPAAQAPEQAVRLALRKYNESGTETATIDLDPTVVAAADDYKVVQKQTAGAVEKTTIDWTRAHA